MWPLGKRLWRTLTGRQQQRAVLVIVAVAVMALLEVFSVSAIAPFLSLAADPSTIEDNVVLAFLYNSFNFASIQEFLIVVGLGVFGLLLISNAWSAVTTWAQLRLIWSWNHQLSVRLLERYLYRPYTYFLSRNTADLSKNLLSEVQQITNQMVKPVILAVGRAVVALGIIAVLVITNPLLAALILVVVGGSYAALYVAVRTRLAAIGRDRVTANRERFTTATEALGGIKDVKILNVEQSFLDRFKGPSYRFARHQATSQSIAALPRFAIETVAFGTVVLIVVYMLIVQHDARSIIPTLGLYAFAGYRLMPALQEIFRAITETRFYSPALNALLDDLERGPDDRRRLVQGVTQIGAPLTPVKSIRLDKITFSYPGAERPALIGISLEIPANSTVGFVGTTGSGKTTVADVLLGLLRPQAGLMLIDDVPLTEDNLHAWQAVIGYVPQHIFLSDASVAENIAFGVPKDEIDMNAVRAAAKIAQIDDFVMRELPEQYDTRIGERGVRLSGGQRQRIGIARALYRDPAVIIFDEATSALDSATEDHVLHAIKSLLGKKTIIMIAHRLTTLCDCDTIFMIGQGRLMAEGSYHELIEGSGAFAIAGAVARRDI